MTRFQVWWLHATVLLTAITGIVFAVMKYLMKSSDEFSVVNHPLQPHMLAAHVVLAPLLVFALGWTFSNHIWPKYRFGEPRSRKSGIASFVMFVPMTLSAYLLQISTNESIRQAMAAAHWITSGLFVVGYVVHLLVKPSR